MLISADHSRARQSLALPGVWIGTAFGGDVPRIALTLILLARFVSAAAFLPKNDGDVIERVPANIWKASVAKTATSTLPTDLSTALDLAKRNIETGKSEGDPRYLSRTEALLSKWCDISAPSVEALILRAYARQSLHAFDEALVDLNAALALRPDETRAWLLKSSIFQVKGNYAAARSASFQLLRAGRNFEATISAAGIASLSGNAAGACAILKQNMGMAKTETEKQWILGILAETEARIGNTSEAAVHFREALQLPRRDLYLMGAFADLLLDQNRPREVIALLGEETRSDSLLTRVVIAEKRVRAAEYRAHAALLQSRFDALRMRGDRGHLREEARFELEARDNPKTALPLALENWKIQREPVDAWLVLASAGGGKASSARPIIEWLDETKLEDIKIKRLTESKKPVRGLESRL